ncbi:helix-turn-helix domain-containing protein [bacterium]|nr:helix-turn-helix domain-containing protein [bacterium]
MNHQQIVELKAKLATAKVDGKTQADVAEEFGISRETLRQYVAKA